MQAPGLPVLGTACIPECETTEDTVSVQTLRVIEPMLGTAGAVAHDDTVGVDTAQVG
jgi:hypothetical protein